MPTLRCATSWKLGMADKPAPTSHEFGWFVRELAQALGEEVDTLGTLPNLTFDRLERFLRTTAIAGYSDRFATAMRPKVRAIANDYSVTIEERHKRLQVLLASAGLHELAGC